MVNNALNINKMNNHLLPSGNEHDIWRWKSRSWLGTSTDM